MANTVSHDFRIILETVNGGKTSYVTSSFVNTNTELVLSSSQVWHRITGSYSCSYVNNSSTSSVDIFQVTQSINFTNSTLLSSSLSGSFGVNPKSNLVSANNDVSGALNTGSIVFTALNKDYDRLLRYKFFGDKVCNTLGLPVNQWIYVDQMRLPADDESNYFEGNIKAKTLFVDDTITFANAANLNSNMQILVNTGSDGADRYIKWVDVGETNRPAVPFNSLLFGFDASSSKYELTNNKTKETFNSWFDINATTITSSYGFKSSNTSNLNILYTGGVTPDASIKFQNADMLIPPNNTISIHDGTNDAIADNKTSIQFKAAGKMIFRASDSHVNELLYLSHSRVGVNTQDNDGDDITHTLTVNGNIKSTGLYVTASGESVIQVGNTGDDLSKWEWHRNGVRKWMIANDGRDGSPDPAVATDALLIKHGISTDGNDHINMSFQQDDQTVYCHGDLSASGDLFLGDVGPGGNTTLSASMSTVTASFAISGGFADIRLLNLPTSDPGVAGQLWNSSGTLKISAG